MYNGAAKEQFDCDSLPTGEESAARVDLRKRTSLFQFLTQNEHFLLINAVIESAGAWTAGGGQSVKVNASDCD